MIDLRNPENIKKLAGWRIEDAGIAPGAELHLVLSNLVDETNMEIIIRPEVQMMVMGDTVKVNKTLFIGVRDVQKEARSG